MRSSNAFETVNDNKLFTISNEQAGNDILDHDLTASQNKHTYD